MKKIHSKGARKAFIRAFVIVFAIFSMTLAAYLSISFSSARIYLRKGRMSPEEMVSAVASELTKASSGEYVLSEHFSEELRSKDGWAMLISNDTGKVVWSQNLPQQIPLNYSFSDIAEFSRLNIYEYPIFLSGHPDGLLVMGYAPGSYINVAVSQNKDDVRKMQSIIVSTLLAFITILAVTSIIIGWISWKDLKAIISGIEEMSQGKAVSLREKGEFSEVAACINATSERLQSMDSHRKRWIAGVSHDIRTPLSIILAKADTAKDTEIRTQAIRIRELITDLNIYSQLEYSPQLRRETFRIAPFIRMESAKFANGIPPHTSVSVEIDASCEEACVSADRHLLKRAFDNILYNSARHNPDGCNISIKASMMRQRLCIRISDDGTKVSEEDIKSMNDKTLGMIPEENIRSGKGLGLYIVSEIIRLHAGKIRFYRTDPQGVSVEIQFETVQGQRK